MRTIKQGNSTITSNIAPLYWRQGPARTRGARDRGRPVPLKMRSSPDISPDRYRCHTENYQGAGKRAMLQGTAP